MKKIYIYIISLAFWLATIPPSFAQSSTEGETFIAMLTNYFDKEFSEKTTISAKSIVTCPPIIDYGVVDFCKNGTNPLPTFIDPLGGIFSSSSPNLVIDPTTGEIDLAGSAVGGPYQITYTTTLGMSGCDGNVFIEVYINNPPVVSLTYPFAELCRTPLPPPASRIPSAFAPAGGTFSIAPAAAGLSVNVATGLISYNAATPANTYTVTYTVNQGGCISNANFNIKITAPLANPVLTYGAAAYCINDPDPAPSAATPAGGVFTAPAGLVINAATGIIDVSASTPNALPYTITYTVSNICGNKNATFDVTINNTPAPPTFTYPSANYCTNGIDPNPNANPPGGTFTALPAGLIINAATGVIDLSASAPNAYIVTYTVTSGSCSNSTNFNLNVFAAPAAPTLSYAAASYCINDPDPAPSMANPAGGVFTAPAGLVINAATGVIDVSASTPNAMPYTITYTISNANCSEIATFDVTISNAPANPTISYPQAAYCTNAIDPSPTVAPAGGAFSAPAGLVINAATGIIDLSASIPNLYTITYTVTIGSCSKQNTFDVTINAAPMTPTLNYVTNTYCVTDPDPVPVFNPPGGVFTAPAGLVINAATGIVDVSASTPNAVAYTVTYTVSNPNCSANITFDITINPGAPTPSLSYASPTYCTNGVDPTPTFSPAGGTFAAPAGLVINAATGIIDVSASTPSGIPYTVTYTAVNGCGMGNANFDVTILAPPVVPTLNYGANNYCTNDPDPAPSMANPAGGVFTAPAGLVINAATGIIDVSASTPNAVAYTITYTLTNTCGSTNATFDVTINAGPPTASLSYTSNTYCTNAVDPTPTFSPAAGIFSAPAGLVINAATGIIDVSASVANNYVVTYTYTNGCGMSNAIFNITIEAAPTPPTLNYAQSIYCANEMDPVPVFNPAGGTFTAPAGLIIDNSTGVIDLSASTPNNYIITYTVTNGTCSDKITFNVTIHAVPPDPGVINGTRCGVGTVLLTATGGSAGNYRWYDSPVNPVPLAGETNATFTTPALNVPITSYYVTIVNANACESNRIQVDALVNVAPMPITVNGVLQHVQTCVPFNTGTIDITVGGGSTPPYTFVWSNGAITEDVANLIPGDYSVTVNDFYNCVGQANFTILDQTQPVIVTVDPGTTIYQGQTTPLNATGGVSYSWTPTKGLSDPTSATPNASPTETTTYQVIVTDAQGCSAADTVTIEVIPNEIFIPNIFTPNADGRNDVLLVFGNAIEEITLKIYDRLGQLLYETSDINEATQIGWNGTYKGTPLQGGNYVWYISGKHLDGRELNVKGKKSGNVLLVR